MCSSCIAPLIAIGAQFQAMWMPLRSALPRARVASGAYSLTSAKRYSLNINYYGTWTFLLSGHAVQVQVQVIVGSVPFRGGKGTQRNRTEKNFQMYVGNLHDSLRLKIQH
eukprot:4324930-Amphidinium_carterae.1